MSRARGPGSPGGRERWRGRRGGEPRAQGQLVLAAAAVIAVALAPMVLAYLQLGAHPDVGPPAPEPGADASRFLERASHEAGTGAAATGQPWGERADAATATREALVPRLETLERSRLDRGTVFEVTYAPDAAAEWAASACPGGPGRAFEPCLTDGGVVLQARAGETTVLAVAYTVTVTSESGSRELTLVAPVVD